MKKLFLVATVFATTMLMNAQKSTTDTTSVKEIEQVEVKALRTNHSIKTIPNKVDIISQKDIEAVPSKNLGDILKKTSSVDILEYQGVKSTIGMRGFTPTAHNNTYTLILINGMPAGTDNVASIDISNAQQIEVLKGPFSSLYGSGAMGGIVNIVTPESTGKIKGRIGLSKGTYQTYNENFSIGGTIHKATNFDFYYNADQQNKNYKTGTNNMLSLTDQEQAILDTMAYNQEYGHSTFGKMNVGGRVGFSIASFVKMNIYTNYFAANDVNSNGTLWGIYGNDLKDITRPSFSMDAQVKITNHLIKIFGSKSIQTDTYYNLATDDHFVISEEELDMLDVNLTDNIRLGNHQLLIGLNSSKKQNSTFRNDVNNKPTAPYSPNFNTTTNAFYGQGSLNFFEDNLNINIGARGEYINQQLDSTAYLSSKGDTTNFVVFTPSVALQYQFLNKKMKVHASYGQGFLTPDAFQMAGTYTSWGTTYVGNPDLDPETSYTYDAGLTINFSEYGFDFDVTYFSTTFENMIVNSKVDATTKSFVNANDSKMEGIELSGKIDLLRTFTRKYQLNLIANYTKMITTEVSILNTNTNVYETSDMKYVRNKNGNIAIEFTKPNLFNVRANMRIIGSRIEDNYMYSYNYTTYQKEPIIFEGVPVRESLINEATLKHPDFLVFDLSGEYIFNKITFGANVSNLFNELYTEKDGFYMPGTMVTGSVSYRF